jgi:glycosyltransferase involved in cell wall biosynthesis
LRERAAARPGWRRVEELGDASAVPAPHRAGVRETLDAQRREVADAFSRASAGLLLVRPEPNHMEMHLRSHKLFEYMWAGLPVIVSDFPRWREFVDANGCGICADPLDPAAIAAAIRRVVDDPEEAERMGARGRDAVRRVYNWEPEGRKLLDLYADLLGA